VGRVVNNDHHFVAVRRLQELCDAGPTPPPGDTGAKFIIRKDGRRINLGFLRDGASKTLEVSCPCHANANRLTGCLYTVHYESQLCHHGSGVELELPTLL
jgi:hypothetical protein